MHEFVIVTCCYAGQKKQGVKLEPKYLNEMINLNFNFTVDAEESFDGIGYQKLYNIVCNNISNFPIIIGGYHSIVQVLHKISMEFQ